MLIFFPTTVWWELTILISSYIFTIYGLYKSLKIYRSKKSILEDGFTSSEESLEAKRVLKAALEKKDWKCAFKCQMQYPESQSILKEHEFAMLYFYVKGSTDDVVKQFVEDHSEKKMTNNKILHDAIRHDARKWVQFLIENIGCNPAEYVEEYNALHTAVDSLCSHDMVNYLVNEIGLDPYEKTAQSYLEPESLAKIARTKKGLQSRGNGSDFTGSLLNVFGLQNEEGDIILTEPYDFERRRRGDLNAKGDATKKFQRVRFDRKKFSDLQLQVSRNSDSCDSPGPELSPTNSGIFTYSASDSITLSDNQPDTSKSKADTQMSSN